MGRWMDGVQMLVGGRAYELMYPSTKGNKTVQVVGCRERVCVNRKSFQDSRSPTPTPILWNMDGVSGCRNS